MKTLAKLALTTAAMALPALSPAQAKDTLTISVYGFAQDAFKDILYTPFEAICDCDLVVETGNSVERLAKLEANKANPVVDMAVMSHFDALQAARADLIQPIDVSKLSNYELLFDAVKDPIGDNLAIGYTAYATSIVYRTDKVKIESWNDLFQDDLKGRVAFPNITTTQGAISLYMVGKAMGDDDMSLKAPMGRIAENRDDFVTFYERTSSLIQLFQQDEIWAASTGRYAWEGLHNIDVPMGWAEPKEGQTGGINVMVMTKGTKNEELALKFMDFWLSTPIQTKLAEAIVDSPVNSEVNLPPEIAENLTYGEAVINNLQLIPAADILDHREEWIETWNNEVAQ